MACIAFWIRGALGLWFAARGEFPLAECSCQKLVWGRRCDGASELCGRSGSGGMAGTWAQKPFAHPILHSPRRRTRGEWVSGTGDPQQSSRAQGAWAARPRFALWRAGGRGKNGLRCFLDPRRVGAVVCCPRRVSLCRMQFPEARYVLSLRRGLGAERPSWLRGHGWDLGAEAFRAPNPAFPTKENPWGVGFGRRRPPAKQQGPGSQGWPSPALPYGERRAGGANSLC